MRFVWTLFTAWMIGANAQGVYDQVVLHPTTGYAYSPPQVYPVNPYPYQPSVYSAPVPAGYGDDGFPQEAECLLVAANISSVSGTLRLVQATSGSPVMITGHIYGLSSGEHGFHMHRDGSVDNNCLGAGPHFNPFNMTHGGPDDAVRHAGDFGNIRADDTGVADVNKEGELIDLQPGSVKFAVGRAIVVHAKADDLGKGGNEESLKTGNAGGRLACCVVQQPHFGTYK